MFAQLIAVVSVAVGAPYMPVIPRTTVTSAVVWQQTKPQVAGTWVINEGESQRPQQFRGQRSHGPTPPPHGHGGHVKQPPSGATGRGGSSKEPLAQFQDALRVVLTNSTDKMIKEDEAGITFVENGGTRVLLTPNAKGVKARWGDAEQVETKLQWTKEGLLMERKFEGGVKVRELYTREAGSPRLTIVTTISARALAEDFTFRRVYDPVAG